MASEVGMPGGGCLIYVKQTFDVCNLKNLILETPKNSLWLTIYITHYPVHDGCLYNPPDTREPGYNVPDLSIPPPCITAICFEDLICRF